MPDEIFCALFENAYGQVERGKALLDLRDAVNEESTTWKISPKNVGKKRTVFLPI
ncbi:hypothetical protein RHM58_12205 [Pseudomonas sp. 10S4]|uniref:hypothetical protein n=1 Tax=Pseudomonas sp. 10S4 TaxID=3048583 RepID=UPI002AC9E0D5|nr:hypothetical protein [Pseudomonas sp. 10S4]WPX20590.1 hypothetical protein RHM58_12205 [Pseudomonas sp. 10S4]